MEIIFILGASDPEMESIQELLDGANVNYIYAMKDGKRVHPGNAYSADIPADDDYEDIVVRGGVMYLVECEINDPRLGLHGNPDTPAIVFTIDHHRPGDPGFGKGPEDFLSASSIGQVFTILQRCHHYVAPGKKYKESCNCSSDDGFTLEALEASGWKSCGNDHKCTSDKWVLVDEDGVCRHYPHEVPDEIVVVAAADHCLGHAYRGLCPGVNKNDLMAWRVRTRAAFQNRSEDDVMADISSAVAILTDPKTPILIGVRDYYALGVVHEDALDGAPYDELDPIMDLRDSPVVIPELPEAGAIEGIAYCAIVSDKGGKRKVVLGCATPDQVRAWMVWAELEGLTGIYGDPARGFAGGYLDG